jgi:glycosyltransferase involved in cell wall biosynthesis
MTHDEPRRSGSATVSVVTSTFNEELNLPVLYERLADVLGTAADEWELIVVDDHSSDGTFEVVGSLARSDPRVVGFRLSRNFGSHVARMCGLHRARGDCAIVMASDLQDPPELIPALLARWRSGVQVVTGVRKARPGEKASTIWLSRSYVWIMRNLLGLSELPVGGGTYLLLDRRVLDALRQVRETNLALHALVHWLGFRTAAVGYEQQPRLHGRSGWTLAKKINLFLDSVTGFSGRPLRWIWGAGVAVTSAGLGYCGVLAGLGLAGRALPMLHWLIAIVVLIGGIQITVLGVLGEYLWRALAESRRRPQYVIEASIGPGSPGEPTTKSMLAAEITEDDPVVDGPRGMMSSVDQARGVHS